MLQKYYHLYTFCFIVRKLSGKDSTLRKNGGPADHNRLVFESPHFFDNLVSCVNTSYEGIFHANYVVVTDQEKV